MSHLSVKIISSIHAIDPAAWNQLSAGRPFQSHQWYVFGERVMADCQPLYALVYEDTLPIARASLWLVRNEPIPSLPAPLRAMVAALLKRWPLLICRSPMSNATGLILPEARRAEILSALTEAVLADGRRRGVSIVLFDFLNEAESNNWPSGFVKMKMPSPGTFMKNNWQSMDEFLANSNRKNRKHYKQTLRESEKLGIRLTKRTTVPHVDEALELIGNVETKHSAASNPWARGLLQHVELIGGYWLEARIADRLVACGLALEDNNAQITTALGLANDVPYAYFMLLYASLEIAFERKLNLLRWGSGAYEVKQRLGFEMERNNFLMLAGANPLTKFLLDKLNANAGKGNHDLS